MIEAINNELDAGETFNDEKLVGFASALTTVRQPHTLVSTLVVENIAQIKFCVKYLLILVLNNQYVTQKNHELFAADVKLITK